MSRKIILSYSPLYFSERDAGSSKQIINYYTNASPTTALPQGQALSVNSSGLLVPLDITNQISWSNFVGYAFVRIPTSSEGQVISNGRLVNFTTALAIGTPLYIGLDGNPTATIPSTDNGFPSGALAIFLGVIVPNELNPSEKDISLFTQFIDVL